jgi:hypothetical protein
MRNFSQLRLPSRAGNGGWRLQTQFFKNWRRSAEPPLRDGNQWDRQVVSVVAADVSPRILYRVKISADLRRWLRQKRVPNEIHFKHLPDSGI